MHQEEEELGVKVDRIYAELGGVGRFQWYALVALLTGMTGPAWWFFEVGYFTQEPEAFICTYASGADQPECTKENICSGNPAILDWKADPNDVKTLYNWIDQLDLLCEDSWKVGIIGSCFFIGWCATLLWLPALTDKYGRKIYFWLSVVICVAAQVGMLFTNSLAMMCAMIGIQGLAASLRLNVGYVYLMELLPSSSQTAVTAAWCIIDSMIYLTETLVYW